MTGTQVEATEQAMMTAHGLTKRFGNLTAVSNVDLELRSSSITALIGPNGAGKSTVVNLLSGLLLPSAGEIRYAGGSVRGMHPYELAHLGVLRTFQTPRLCPGLSAAETVTLGLQAHDRNSWARALFHTPGLHKKEDERRAEALAVLEEIDVEGVDVEVTALAVGTQRLVELARALVGGPTVLLLDEPGAGLDPSESAALAALLRKIAASGPAVLLIEHDMSVVMSVADRVVVLDHGAVIATGTPAEVSRNEAVIEAYLGPQES
ncbi:MAG TPA: ABC transporter ATP-binding protein [Solirubrobacterales bacterium]|jgi:branched-chain amino acid transport system ATP-binding protein